MNIQLLRSYVDVNSFDLARAQPEDESAGIAIPNIVIRNIICETINWKYMGVSENSVPLNPMVLLIIIPIKWLFHWEYTIIYPTFSDKPIYSNSHANQILTVWSPTHLLDLKSKRCNINKRSKTVMSHGQHGAVSRLMTVVYTLYTDAS